MNVSLTPELEALVNEKVASGMYNSASEVVREALRLLKDHDELKRIRHEELRREIAIGIESLERGEYKTYDEHSLKDMFEEIKAKGRARLTARQKRADV